MKLLNLKDIPSQSVSHNLLPSACAVVELGEYHELENKDEDDLVILYSGIRI
jgi:hypothetical protein